MIAIVDYRAGNLASVARALEHLGQPGVITSDPDIIAAADRIVFPGVGAAGEAMRNLHELRLKPVLLQAVADGKPFLGICLGYQILFERSEEDGGVACLGLLPGRVTRFAESAAGATPRLKVPHMGWNQAAFLRPHPVWHGVPAGCEFYFVHSYYPRAPAKVTACTTDYGVAFASGAATGSLVGFQFHPEKSGLPGLRLLHNFCHWSPE